MKVRCGKLSTVIEDHSILTFKESSMLMRNIKKFRNTLLEASNIQFGGYIGLLLCSISIYQGMEGMRSTI